VIVEDFVLHYPYKRIFRTCKLLNMMPDVLVLADRKDFYSLCLFFNVLQQQLISIIPRNVSSYLIRYKGWVCSLLLELAEIRDK